MDQPWAIRVASDAPQSRASIQSVPHRSSRSNHRGEKTSGSKMAAWISSGIIAPGTRTPGGVRATGDDGRIEPQPGSAPLRRGLALRGPLRHAERLIERRP